MAKSRKVLIIDDEPANLELLSDLFSEQFLVFTALTGEEGIRLARSELPDVILLDLMMPKQDGVKTCEILRSSEATRHIPVIILTGSLDTDPRIRAFLSGADDLVPKPFQSNELLARVQSKIRRIEEREGLNQLLKCGNLTLDLEKLEAQIDGNPVPLSVLEFNLLKYFVENKNKVVSRQKILDAVWRDSVVSDRTVDTHMTSLRKKLANFDHVFATVYAAGYILKEPTPNALQMSGAAASSGSSSS